MDMRAPFFVFNAHSTCSNAPTQSAGSKWQIHRQACASVICGIAPIYAFTAPSNSAPVLATIVECAAAHTTETSDIQ